MRAPQQLTGPRRASARSNMGRNRRANSVAQQGGRRVATNPGSTSISRVPPRSTGTPRAAIRPVRPTPTRGTPPPSVVPLGADGAYQNFMTQYQQTIGSDPLLQDLFRRRDGLNVTLNNKQRQYIASLGLTRDQMNNPVLAQIIGPAIQNFIESQQEFTILRNLLNSQQQYMNQTYPGLQEQMEKYRQQMFNNLGQQQVLNQQQFPTPVNTQIDQMPPTQTVGTIGTPGGTPVQGYDPTTGTIIPAGGTYQTMGNDVRFPPGFNPDGTPVQGVSANPTVTGGTPTTEQATQVGGGRVLPDYEKDFIVPGSRPETGTTPPMTAVAPKRPRPFVDPRIEPRKERVPNRPTTPTINQPKPVSGPRPGLATPKPQGN